MACHPGGANGCLDGLTLHWPLHAHCRLAGVAGFQSPIHLAREWPLDRWVSSAICACVGPAPCSREEVADLDQFRAPQEHGRERRVNDQSRRGAQRHSPCSQRGRARSLPRLAPGSARASRRSLQTMRWIRKPSGRESVLQSKPTRGARVPPYRSHPARRERFAVRPGWRLRTGRKAFRPSRRANPSGWERAGAPLSRHRSRRSASRQGRSARMPTPRTASCSRHARSAGSDR